MSTNKTTQTEVQTVDVNLDELLGIPGAESVMTPGEPSEKKPSIFSSVTPDTTFLDKPNNNEEKDTKTDADSKAPTKSVTVPDPDETEIDDPTDPVNFPAAPDADDNKSKGGRPNGLVTLAKKLIEKGRLLPFDEDKKLEDYTVEDFEELFETNFEEYENNLSKELPNAFFNHMPDEMKQAYEYIANGGQDIKGMFRALAVSQEIRDLDISNEDGQKYAIRSYLQATRWGTPEEIEDEINSLEDKNELAKKAKQFKPKLDAMQQQIVNQRLADQQQQQKLRAAQSQKYIENVYSTLEKGELNGIKLDNKTQNMLYAGLIQSNYPSMSGKQTNMLGHLLEKYQWVEPRHDLIAEALWLLSDPDGYRKNIAEGGATEANKKTLRTLKTEQASSRSASNENADDEPANRQSRRTITRNPKNFFGRQ